VGQLDPGEADLVRLIRELGLDGAKVAVLGSVARALAEVKYGEVIVKLQAGRPAWVDKYERERVG
jgi:hypothetical protein